MITTSIDPTLISRVLDFALALQQIPAPPFGESQRAEFIYTAFQVNGNAHVEMDEVGNVLARIPGKPDRPPLIVTAHMDTVFPLSTPLQSTCTAERIYAPAIGDNSIGVASLFALLWILHSSSTAPALPADVWLIANVGEEGLGNLRGMRKVVERFSSNVLAYLVVEGMSLGLVFHRGLEIRRYRIAVKTPGGHSWVDYGSPSAIAEISRLVTRLTDLPIPHTPRTSLNVGTISGGTGVNTIAAEAHLELDLRSESTRTVDKLAGLVETAVLEANRPAVAVSMNQIGHRPGGKIPARHPLVQLAARCLKRQGIQPQLSAGSTDANIPLSLKFPAICVGVTHGSGAHTTGEFIETAYIAQGLGQLADLVQSILVGY